MVKTTVASEERLAWDKAKKMFPIYDDVEPLVQLYSGHGSFAVVRHGSDFDKPGFVALTPRHMTAKLWRALYALGVKNLVIYGRSLGGLCDTCLNAIPCLHAGRGVNPRFKCSVTEKLLTIKIGRRDRGRDREEVSP